MYLKKLLRILKSIAVSAVFVMAANSVFAQEFGTLWDRTVGNDDTRPTWFSTGDEEDPAHRGTERGITYSATTGHLYVSSRKDGLPSIHIIDPATGEDLGVVFTMGIEAGGEMDGGGYCLNNIVATEGGQIAACNMTLASGPPLPDGTIKAFRVYKWDYEMVMPVMILDYEGGGYRLGDKFSVHGDLTGDAVIYAGPSDSNKVLKWTVTGGVVNPEPEIITLAGVTSAGTSSVVAQVPGTDNFYVSGKGFLPTYFMPDGTNLTQVQISAGPGRICGRLAENDEGELFMAMYQGADNYMNAILINMTDHGENIGDDDIYGETPSLGGDVTAFGEGAVEIANIDGAIHVFVCAPDIGIAGYTTEPSGVNDMVKNAIGISNYPNPFNSTTNIEYSVPDNFNGNITISVYNVSGKLVSEFNNPNNTNEKNTFTFDASELPGGIYFCKLRAGDFVTTQKMVLIK